MGFVADHLWQILANLAGCVCVLCVASDMRCRYTCEKRDVLTNAHMHVCIHYVNVSQGHRVRCESKSRSSSIAEFAKQHL
jgi:hypothetical protein